MGTLDLGVNTRQAQLLKEIRDDLRTRDNTSALGSAAMIAELQTQNALLRRQLDQARYHSDVLYAILGTLRGDEAAPPAVPTQGGQQ